MSSKRGNPGLKGRLVEKSIEAYIDALETINSLSRKYRAETFAILLCNAWELLLKARIIDVSGNKNAVYYELKPRPKSHSLEYCIKQNFPDEREPARRNLEIINGLRNEATHLVICRVPPEVMALFQASVLNYHRFLGEWFEISLHDRVPLGMMSLVYDLAPESLDFKDKTLRRQMGAATFDYLSELQAEILTEFEALGKPAEFSLGIDYSLALVKKAGAADIVLANASMGKPTNVVKVAKDAFESHPLRCKEVREQLEPIIGKEKANAHLVTSVVKAHCISQRADFYYQGSIKGVPKQ